MFKYAVDEHTKQQIELVHKYSAWVKNSAGAAEMAVSFGDKRSVRRLLDDIIEKTKLVTQALIDSENERTQTNTRP